MKRNWLIFVVLWAPLFLSAAGRQADSGAQNTQTAGFPEQALRGSEEFTIAIDVQGDLRGNVGPCG